MKAKNILGLAVAALLTSGMVASNAVAADGTGTASASVITPITVAAGASTLDWGTIVPGPGGTVTVPANGAAVGSTGVNVLTAGGRGTMDIAGDPNRAFTASIPAALTVIGTNNPGNTMSASMSVDQPTPNLDGSGDATVGVGGVLTVGAAQAPDSYSGTFTVTANY